MANGAGVPDTVWHYLGPEGLLGITAEGQIYATSALSLNDTSELQYGLTLAGDVWDGIKDGIPRKNSGDLPPDGGEFLHRAFSGGFLNIEVLRGVFVLSASDLRDDLGQWRGYAGGRGYALGIDTATVFVRADLPHDSSSIDVDWMPDPGWRRVIYDESEQRAAIRAAIDEVLKLTADDYRGIPGVARAQGLIGSVIVSLKHPSFRSESEVRYVYSAPDYTHAQYRPGRFGITPYLALTTDSERLPITSVICGPSGGRANDAEERVTQQMLVGRGYGVSVTSSCIPFRV